MVAFSVRLTVVLKSPIFTRVSGTRKRGYLPSGLGLFTLSVYLFLYAPIIVLSVLSFNHSRFGSTWQGFSWHWYELAFTDDNLIRSLRVSLFVALLTTIVATVLGTLTAYAMARYRYRLTSLIEGLVFLPVIIPEIVIGFAMAGFFGLLGAAFGVGTIVAAHVALSISYVVFIVRARVAGLDRSLEDAAMDLGATPLATFFKVTLPLIAPGIVSAALLVFTLSLDDYVITSFVAGPGATTLPLKIYSMVKTGVTPEINAISTVLLVATIILAFVAERLSSNRSSRLTLSAGGGALLLLMVFAFGGQTGKSTGGELNIFVWSNYLPDSVIAKFESRYHAKVNVELYDSNEAMLARLQAGGGNYDIIVPSDYMVTVLREQGLLLEVDRDRLTNFSNLDPRFVGLSHDPTNTVSVPYLWGTTGIGFRKDKVEGAIDRWEVLWDARYRDRIAMLDDVREVMGAALKKNGKSLNSLAPQEIEEAGRALLEQKPLVKAYDSGGFDQLLLSGDAWIVQGYNGQIAKAMLENPMIGYAVPKEGCTLSVDNLCIPKSAEHVELALAFINFILEPEIAAEIANETGYATANLAARPFIKPELLNNEAVFPSPESLEHCEAIQEVGETINLYDRVWTMIKSE